MISIPEIVAAGLCIGCGVCKAIAPESIQIELDENGVERPRLITTLPDEALHLINEVCPGLRVEASPEDVPIDPTWGPVARLAKGHATDAEIRFRSASGGVLTALGVFLLESRRVEHVLHVAPCEDSPLEWRASVSSTVEEVIAGTSSRYGPVAPLTPLLELVERGRPTAVIAKPCDIAAVRNLIESDPRAGKVILYLLTMACGGASKLTKQWRLLEQLDIGRHDVASLRHRGRGNPGPTRITTRDGQVFDKSYLELWEDEGTWELQWRCKVCPDGMGEVADLVALDCWPGGAPVGEDEGFNGIIARTSAGLELLSAAIDSGVLHLTDDDLPTGKTLESWQPHQSRRKSAVGPRLRAMELAGLPSLRTEGLRLEMAEDRLSPDERNAELHGAVDRLRLGVE